MLELKNITAGYGKNTVLCDLNVTFEKGKLTSVVGVNGCGKSTLLKAALGIIPLERGTVTADGAELSSLKRTEIAKRLAYLSQGRDTPDMTVQQMVLHGRFPHLSYPRRYSENDRETARRAMEKVGILHLANESLSALSGGMRQTAYIAMALTQDTDYILLDEPCTYLDIAHQLSLMKLLRELAEGGKGIVAVMHDLPMAFDFSHKIAVVSSGQVIAMDTPSAVSASSVIAETFGITLRHSPEYDKYSYKY